MTAILREFCCKTGILQMKTVVSDFVQRKLTKLIISVLLIAFFSVSETHALEGGYGNYVPGLYGGFLLAVTPPPGWYMLNQAYFYFADSNNDFVRQGDIVTDIDLNEGYYILTLAWASDFKILGGSYGFGISPSVGYTDISGNFIGEIEEFRFEDSDFGLSDLGITPVALFWNFDKIYLSLSETIVVPIGEYDVNRQANLGLNYWSFDTNFAVTYFDKQKGLDISLNLGHMYNTKNNATEYKSGQEIHLDYTINHFFSNNFATGLQGFYHRQITGDSGDGAILGDFKAVDAGVGPAVLWHSKVGGKSFVITAKWLYEFHVENRLKGNYIFFNLLYEF